MAMGCQTLIPNTNGTKRLDAAREKYFLSFLTGTEIDLNVILNCILLVLKTKIPIPGMRSIFFSQFSMSKTNWTEPNLLDLVVFGFCADSWPLALDRVSLC